MVEASRRYIPVFIDTLQDSRNTRRFGEHFGSYPVLRVHNLQGKDVGGRLDGNACCGDIPVQAVLDQLDHGMFP